MKINRPTSFLGIVIALAALGFAERIAVGQGAIRPARLRCEDQENPIAIASGRPRFSWLVDSVEPARRGQRQTAYQILAASSETVIKDGRGDLWDSGKVASDENAHVAYAGRLLKAKERGVWKVRLWDQDGKPSGWSEPASFTMGLLSDGDWQARWISGNASPLPLFRKEFDIAHPLRRAIVYVCGLGHYELRLNGRRVGDREIDPGWTNYRKTCLYSAYDVTDQLAAGRNAIGVMLGNGMYNVVGGRYVKFKGSFGPPKLILRLDVEHNDGTCTTIVTDESWKTADGPIRFSCEFGGEDYDARFEMPGWDRAGFDDAKWKAAEPKDGPGGGLRSQLATPIKVIERLSNPRVTTPKPGVCIYDLGRNFAGRPSITVRGRAGATVRLTPGELLDGNGLVTQRSSGGPMWFSYTLRGEGDETWVPRFSYYGFRYVQVEGAAPPDAGGAVTIVALGGEILSNSAEVVGEFECSNTLINRIHVLINAAIRSNLQSVLTDCPHREKLGWLEVSHLLARGIMYNYHVPRLYSKISQDMREAQLENGFIPDIAPEYVVFKDGFRDSPEWASACAFNPWQIHKVYGDRGLLDANYDVMKRYVDYLATTAKDHIVSHGLGDWYDIGPGAPGASKLTSTGLTATAIYYGDVVIVAEAAGALGKADEARRYADLAAEVRKAFNRRFFDPAKNQYDRGSQTAQAMPLVLGLVEDDKRAAVLESLVRIIRADGNRVTAGDVGFMYLVRALSDAGRGDVLFDVVCQPDGPGYADQLRKGATTLTEAWDADPNSSHNHCMLGHAEEWFYRGLGGLVPDEAAPGFKRFVLKPQIVGDVTWARIRYDSVRGRIVSHWRIDGDRFIWDVVVPPNTTAILHVPAKDPATVMEGGKPADQSPGVRPVERKADSAVFEIGGGTYRFTAARR